ncbi:MAG: Mth938-like domain-containing protein [Rhodocyclaceae bacterium]|nr:Mth938-like domain-containing protein [Rhodocyclaceae bacterium]MBX3668605.1 Mth938-like domain-containing protein [Rhodocyclaceae bacterium]
MKLHLDKRDDTLAVTAHGPGYLEINRQRYAHGIVLLPNRIAGQFGNQGFEALSSADFAALCELGADVVLIGTGSRQRFPAPALLRPLVEAHVGFEVMDTAAACRTYNILMGEGRAVVAALMLEPA